MLCKINHNLYNKNNGKIKRLYTVSLLNNKSRIALQSHIYYEYLIEEIINLYSSKLI